MRRTKEDFDNLTKDEIYSLLLFALYQIKDIPEYATLSELSYILNRESLLNFLEYYGGMTITIPTIKDLRIVTQALLLYEYINLKGYTYASALRTLNCKEYEVDKIKNVYYKIYKVLSKYDFKRK